MTKTKKNTIALKPGMLDILQDMVNEGDAETIDEALEIIFSDWLTQSAVDSEIEQIGVVYVDSGVVIIADPSDKDEIPEPIDCIGKELCWMTAIATPHGDGVFPVYKEEWDDVLRIVIEFPKLGFGAIEGEEVN